jgi:hypothetical protein
MADVAHLVKTIIVWCDFAWLICWLIYRWHRFMQKHQDPKAKITTIFNGEK